MKNTLALICTLGLLATACNDQPVDTTDPNIPLNNQIYYTSTNNSPIAPNLFDSKGDNGWGANISSNTYEEGKGILTFDGDITAISQAAFYDLATLKTIFLPSTLEEIGSEAFYRCSELWSVNLPSKITEIKSHTFYGCKNLRQINLHNNITKIDAGAFRDCENLGTIIIPDQVTTIREYAFRKCTGAVLTIIPNSVTSLGTEAFLGPKGKLIVNCDIPKYAFKGCYFTEVYIGDEVTSVGTGAFINNANLQAVHIQAEDIEIDYQNTFIGCHNLELIDSKFATEDGRCLILDGTLFAFAPAGITDYTLPNNTTTIANEIFNGCDELQSITIPESVTKIGDYAFANCTNLTSIYCKSSSIPSIGYEILRHHHPDLKIYVPEDKIKLYQRKWHNYANLFVPYNFE